jgi:hypothetical protein
MSRFRRLLNLLIPMASLLLLAVVGPGQGRVGPAAVASPDRPACPYEGNDEAARGWALLREGRVDEAGTAFKEAARRCPEHAGALTGLGFVALRQADATAARAHFSSVLAQDSSVIDAWTGLGLAAWREDDLVTARHAWSRTLALDPGNTEARGYLERVPAAAAEPPARPPLVRPDTVEHHSRAHGDRFEIRVDGAWQPFYVKGMNLGAALPGRHPSQFPDSAAYAEWIRGMAEMHVNAIRVYTIHPPAFYQALLDHNTGEGPDLWVIHGVWTDLPPDHDYVDPVWEGRFFEEMRRVVDVLHGRADLPIRPGHAGGYYTADVSRWVLAFVIGREWEPFSVQGYLERKGTAPGHEGEYITVAGGNALDAWMAKACEVIVAYESEAYHQQRPVAYTNWPTLDPLRHPTESTVDEELSIRAELGEDVDVRPREYDNDAVGLDGSLLRATDRFPAGVFASYHAYPYYPDFMFLDPAHQGATSAEGPSTYFGYLRRLKAHHPGMPVLMAEYGVPTGMGLAHVHPQGWNHGGLTEGEQADINARMTREIAEAGFAGGALFAWMDEWFKKNWLVIDFEQPLERNRLWLNRLDPEQQYGMVAMEARPAVDGDSLEERLAAWRRTAPSMEGSGGTLRTAVDEAYLWLLIDGAGGPGTEFFVGFDVFDPRGGDVRWPRAVGPQLPVGVEFVLHISRDTVRLMADPPSNPWRIVPVRDRLKRGAAGPDLGAPELPGIFVGRFEQRLNHPFRTRPNEDGLYEPLRVLPNRPRFGRDGAEFGAVGYDRGVLREGAPPDGYWEWSADGAAIEVRIPWLLLNVTDPSSRRVVQGGPGSEDFGGEVPTRMIETLGLTAAVRVPGGGWTAWPNEAAEVATLTWSTWEEPEWVERRRPTYFQMRETYRTLDPLGAGRTVEP